MHKFWASLKFWYGAGYFTALTAAYFYQCWRLHISQCMVCKKSFHRMNVDICRKCSWQPLLDHNRKAYYYYDSSLFPVSYE